MPLDENDNPVADTPGEVPGDTPEGEPGVLDPPAGEPAVRHTIGDDIKAVEQDVADALNDQEAALAAQDKAKASAAKALLSKSHLADDLKKIGGDTFTLNPDGTATAYYASATNADGYYTEILKPADTVIPDDAPSV